MSNSLFIPRQRMLETIRGSSLIRFFEKGQVQKLLSDIIKNPQRSNYLTNTSITATDITTRYLEPCKV